MSAPHDNNSDGKYPEDGVSHYPKKKLHKMASKVVKDEKAEFKMKSREAKRGMAAEARALNRIFHKK